MMCGCILADPSWAQAYQLRGRIRVGVRKRPVALYCSNGPYDTPLYLGVLGLFLLCPAAAATVTDPSAASATSNLCANVTGTEAILWDLYNGVIRTDVSVLPPPVPVPGGSYTNPAFPLLGFIYPAGWSPTTTSGGFQQVGVNLIRQDQQAIWREDTQVINGVISARDARDFEIQSLLEFLGKRERSPKWFASMKVLAMPAEALSSPSRAS